MKNSKESGEQLRAKPATRHRRLDKAEPVEKKSGWMDENRERLAAALESLGDGIVVTQTDGTICYVNPAFERLTGFATEEIVGKNGSVFVTNGNFRKLQGLIRETLQRNTIWTGSVAIGKKDGSSFEAEVSIVPRLRSFDKRVEYVTVVRDVTERKQTEEALQARMRLQEVMAAISTDFAVLSPQDTDKGIARALQKVGKFAGADSAYVLLFSDNGAKVGCLHEWRAQGMESQIDRLQRLFLQNFPWWTERLSQFNSIHIPWVAELPPEASAERELLQAQGIQSLLAVPVVHRESLIGLLGIHSAQQARIQSGETVELLRMLSNFIADALEHQLGAEALKESEERYRCLADATLEGIVIHDGDRVLDVNSTCAAMLGYTPSEFLGRSGLDFIAPESRQLVAEKIRTKCEEPYLATALRKDDSTFPIEICAHKIPYKGQTVRVVAFRDMTERKRTEGALRESEFRYRALFEHAGDYVLVLELNPEGVPVIVDANRAALKTLGYSREEMVGKLIAIIDPDISPQVLLERERLVYGSKTGVTFQVRRRRKDGSVFLAESTASVIQVGEKELTLAVERDVTERKQAEIGLQASQERLKEAQAIGKIGNWELDLVTGRVIWSDQMYRLYERDPGTEPLSLEGEPVACCPEDMHLLRDAMKRAAQLGEASELDLRATLPSGKSGWHHGVVQPVQDEHGKVVRVVGTVQDITERKKTEELLRTGKVHLLNALRIAKLGNWEYDVAKDLFTFSDEFYTLFRTTAEQVGGYTLSSARYAELFVHPEDRSVVADEVRKAIEATDPNYSRQLEHRMVYTDGETGHVAVRFQIVKDSEGRTVRTYGVNQDITERKRAETALRESEAKFRTITSTANDAIIMLNNDGSISYWNPAAEEIFGYTSDEAIGKEMHTLIAPAKYHEAYRKGFRVFRETGKGAVVGKTVELEAMRKDGTEFPIEISLSAIQIKGRWHPVGIARDITERKRAEATLRESEERLRVLFDNLTIGVYRTTPEGEILTANPALVKLLGYSSFDELSTRNLEEGEFHPAYPRNQFKERIERDGEIRGLESAWTRDDGITIYVRETARAVRGKDGKTLYYEGTVEDVTERKKGEEALRESEEKYRDLVENINEVIYAVDMHSVLTYVSPVAETLMGYKASEVTGHSIADFIHPEDREHMVERFQRVLRGEPRQSSEFRIMTKSDAVCWVQTSSRPIVHDDQILGVQGVLIDITERKRVEEALRESEERLRILFDNLTIGVYRTTPEGRILTANPAFVKMLGYSAFDELAARNLDEEAVYLAYPRDQFKALMERDGEIRGLEAVWKRRDGSFSFVRENARAVRGEDGEILHYEGTAEDITERKRAEERTTWQQRIVSAINAVLKEALGCESEESLAHTCLEVAQELVGAKFGFFGEVNLEGKFDTLAISNPGWDECKMPKSEATRVIKGMEIRGVQLLALKDGESQIFNDPSHHPASVGTPEGHPEITCFLAVPLKYGGKIIGQIGLGNKEGGYDLNDQEAIEALSSAMVEALMRKRAEEALHKSEEKYRILIDQQGEGVVIADPDERFMFCNPAAEEIFGVPRGTLVGRNFEEFVSPQTLESVRKQTSRRRKGEKSAYEIEITRPSGEKRHIVILATPWLDKKGQFAGAWGIFRDETERKRAETKLRFRVELENVISTISTDFINLDSSEIDHGINRALQKIGEFTGADRSYVFLLSKDGTMADNTHEWCAEGVEPQIDNMKRMSADAFPWWAEKMLAFEDIYIPRVADLPEEAASEKAMLEAQGIKSLIVIPMVYRESLIGFVGFDFVREEKAWTQDVEAILRMAGDAIANALEHKETENALRESEAKYRSLIQNSNDAIYLLVEGKFEIINRRFSEMFGVTSEEVREPSFNFLQMVAPRSHPLLDERMRMAQRGEVPPPRYEFTALTKDGREVEVETSVSRIPYRGGTATQGILRDITDRKRLEAQLRQAQKMEAIGTLAGGIAHDFNNILMAMLGYAEMAKIDLPEGTVARSDLEEVLKAGGRARDLVRQILAFSRQIDQERQPVQLHPVIKEALKLLRASLPATIEIQQNIDTDCGVVLADPTQIHQVLMNLCSNAHHAMRDKGGILEVELKSVDVDADFAVLIPNLREGPYVRLTVSDTGYGMDRATMERIFEPFFTTKAVGEGTGMGLATVHGIVTSHNGAITVYSEAGKGTTFHVYLPRLESKAPDAPLQVESIPTGKERILFVDDEASLARLGKQMLERLGYSVTTRTSSVEALEAFRAKSDMFDLVITDQTMPNITGMELAEEMMRIRPDIPIILATGFSETISPEKAKRLGIREYIMKPVAARELAIITRQVLDEMEKVK